MQSEDNCTAGLLECKLEQGVAKIIFRLENNCTGTSSLEDVEKEAREINEILKEHVGNKGKRIENPFVHI